MRITLESIPRTFKQPIKHLEKIQVKNYVNFISLWRDKTGHDKFLEVFGSCNFLHTFSMS